MSEKRAKTAVDRKRLAILQVRLKPSEKIAFERAAQIAGVPLSIWVRERLRAATYRELDNVGETAPFLAASENGNG